MKKNDIILVIILVCVAVLSYIIIKMFATGGTYVEVTKDGNVIGRYSLSEDGEHTIGDDDEYNILVIKDGKAEITDANCPNRTCVGQKAIDASGGSIICVPNKVVVKVANRT